MEKNNNAGDFLESNFEIFGEYNNIVYRRKRNGEIEKYPYIPKSPYRRTPLTIRNEWIRKFAARISNPQKDDYKSVIHKLNYYTPYILPAGSQKFLAETVFYIRQKGEYEFLWQGSDAGIIYKLYKRTEISLNFRTCGEKLLQVISGDSIYCERRFIITTSDLDAEYEAWLNAHFAEILLLPEPEYASLPLYRRGMRSKRNWIQAITGKREDEVFYIRSDLLKRQKQQTPHQSYPFIYHRREYDHSENPQTQEFNGKMPQIALEWQALSTAEKRYWQRQANKLTGQRLTAFNAFTRFYLATDYTD